MTQPPNAATEAAAQSAPVVRPRCVCGAAAAADAGTGGARRARSWRPGSFVSGLLVGALLVAPGCTQVAQVAQVAQRPLGESPVAAWASWSSWSSWWRSLPWPAAPTSPAAGSPSDGAAAATAPLPAAPERGASAASAPTALITPAAAQSPAQSPAEAGAAEGDVAPAAQPAATPAGVPFPDEVERWRPLAAELLAEARGEGRLSGPAARLDTDFVLAVIQQESAGDPEASSWAGAIGLMQVMPETFAEMMAGDRALVDQIPPDAFWDVRSNMRAGIRYLALAMQADEGNLYWTLAAYNAGIEAVDDWRAAGLYAVPPIGGYEETANYAQVILRNYLDHRPDVSFYVPDPMPYEHVPGAIMRLKAAGRW